ncbi:MAG: DUF4382 domain-containing protein [Gammaproteobacteria bacterium]|jgi:hypothetical protein|nr:DUF4382 domain-containing protein [Gammaproteobacteria bacterium]MDH3846202.1 DUF4382 domain-containing protein [Gammaproteobacteria bacterium]MDH3862472.1 DUF4382 domain-containing protein [Gammaproteobacteria bacterium]MDH3908854.1 DUF4382 domain-containing protein [Gammaproteobacteria bacterium]MDH4005674.1 DUF4382 domain-containing protein [Gammaproteobacteria bacterium]
MNKRSCAVAVSLASLALLAACGGGSSSDTAAPPPTPVTGTISVSITDDPWHDMDSMVIRITGMDFGHSNGEIHSFDMPGGPMDVDMMQLQNGVSHALMSDIELPGGDYDWMRMRIDVGQSFMRDSGTGGHYGFRMGHGATEGLEVHEQFHVEAGAHGDYMLEYDVRRGVRHSHNGMMGDQYELHNAMHLVRMDQAGGLFGAVDPSLVDINHPACDDADGGNWMYVYPGDAEAPDDISDTESDGIPGPIATDRVEMNPGSGAHEYHFGYLPEGTYRVAFTCSGEWDEPGDDDYPSDPDGLFDFQHFSGPIEIVAGQMHQHDL